MAEITDPKRVKRKKRGFTTDSKLTAANTGEKLPLPSLEDVRDSEKTEFFSINGKNADI